MVKLLRNILKGLIALLLYWCTIMFCVLGVGLLGRTIFKEIPILIGIGAFVAGIFFFKYFKFTRIYVFGHEMTHYLVAKLFLKDTGKIKLGKSQGSVEVTDPNACIILAPYFIPFYVLLVILIFSIVNFFWKTMPGEGIWVFGWGIGTAWAYHAVLTVTALQKEQTDITTYGSFFSYGMIAAGNAFTLLAGELFLLSKWTIAWRLFCKMTAIQWHAISQIFH